MPRGKPKIMQAYKQYIGLNPDEKESLKNLCEEKISALEEELKTSKETLDVLEEKTLHITDQTNE